MANAAAKEAEKPKAPEAPKGYDDAGRPDIDGWAKPAVGTVIHGKIVGFFAFMQAVKDKSQPTGFKMQKREAVCLKVYGNETRAYKKGDQTGSILKEGQVIAMSLNYALEPIREYVEKRGQVWAHFLRKDDIGGGQTVWKVDLKCKGEKTAPAVARLAANVEPAGSEGPDGDGEDDGTIPF